MATATGGDASTGTGGSPDVEYTAAVTRKMAGSGGRDDTAKTAARNKTTAEPVTAALRRYGGNRGGTSRRRPATRGSRTTSTAGGGGGGARPNRARTGQGSSQAEPAATATSEEARGGGYWSPGVGGGRPRWSQATAATGESGHPSSAMRPQGCPSSSPAGDAALRRSWRGREKDGRWRRGSRGQRGTQAMAEGGSVPDPQDAARTLAAVTATATTASMAAYGGDGDGRGRSSAGGAHFHRGDPSEGRSNNGLDNSGREKKRRRMREGKRE